MQHMSVFFSNMSFGVTVHGDTYWPYGVTTPLQNTPVLFYGYFLVGRFTDVVLFGISNSSAIKSCIFEDMAPKSLSHTHTQKQSGWDWEMLQFIHQIR